MHAPEPYVNKHRESDQRVALALLGGVVLFFAWLWILAKAHENGARNLLRVGVLPQVLLGMLLGVINRWIYIAVAVGMFLFPIVDVLRAGPFADCAYVVGWPLAVGGLLSRAAHSYWRQRTAA
jgi:hypothetical protein